MEGWIDGRKEGLESTRDRVGGKKKKSGRDWDTTGKAGKKDRKKWMKARGQSEAKEPPIISTSTCD